MGKMMGQGRAPTPTLNRSRGRCSGLGWLCGLGGCWGRSGVEEKITGATTLFECKILVTFALPSLSRNECAREAGARR